MSYYEKYQNVAFSHETQIQLNRQKMAIVLKVGQITLTNNRLHKTPWRLGSVWIYWFHLLLLLSSSVARKSKMKNFFYSQTSLDEVGNEDYILWRVYHLPKSKPSSHETKQKPPQAFFHARPTLSTYLTTYVDSDTIDKVRIC